MHIEVNGARIFFDTVGPKLAPVGPRMLERPSLIALHGGPGFTHEAIQRSVVGGLGGRQHLDGHTAAHQLMFAEIDAAHAAGAEAFEHLVFADGEAPPLALH